jgi:hypothetical protein
MMMIITKIVNKKNPLVLNKEYHARENANNASASF